MFLCGSFCFILYLGVILQVSYELPPKINFSRTIMNGFEKLFCFDTFKRTFFASNVKITGFLTVLNVSLSFIITVFNNIYYRFYFSVSCTHVCKYLNETLESRNQFYLYTCQISYLSI